MYVAPEARGTGLGRAPVGAAITEAFRDCRTIRLLVKRIRMRWLLNAPVIAPSPKVPSRVP